MGHGWFLKKFGFMAAVAWLGLIVSGSTGADSSYAQEGGDLPKGFKRGERPALPPAEQIERGKRVYFTKCVWCHGVEGAGNGPAADRLWPRPRNFVQGTFKIRHTASGELPLPDQDLFQTVTHGLPGSAMPPWDGILSEDQRRDVIAFVTSQLIKWRNYADKDFESFTVLQLDQIEPIPPTEESLKKGAELIVDKKCIECHGVNGRGDGNPFNLKDDWGFPIQPANWHKCWNFRGSRRDPYNVKNIFRTFSTGLNGTPMPSFADNTTIEERWHIANFVQSLCERGLEGQPLPIDPQTDKPKINFVVPATFVEGEIPSDPEDPIWQKAERRFIALGGQITHKPRNFVNRIQDLWVQALYNKENIAYMIRWDDRSKSVAQEEPPWYHTQVNLADYGVVEQPPATGEENSIAAKQNKYTVYDDAVALEFPIKWQELPPPQKPRYFWGDEKYAVDIMKWSPNGDWFGNKLISYKGTGWNKEWEERPDFTEKLKLLKEEWKDGRWTIIMQRPLKADYEQFTYFERGKYIPTVFFAWDGHNGDAGRKNAVSAFYYTVLKPTIPMTTYLYPTLMAIGIVIVEGWVLSRRRNKREGKV